jgi:hypothetical protein
MNILFFEGLDRKIKEKRSSSITKTLISKIEIFENRFNCIKNCLMISEYSKTNINLIEEIR